MDASAHQILSSYIALHQWLFGTGIFWSLQEGPFSSWFHRTFCWEFKALWGRWLAEGLWDHPRSQTCFHDRSQCFLFTEWYRRQCFVQMHEPKACSWCRCHRLKILAFQLLSMWLSIDWDVRPWLLLASQLCRLCSKYSKFVLSLFEPIFGCFCCRFVKANPK